MKITHNKIGQNLNLSDSGRTEKAKDAKVNETKGENVQALKEFSSQSKANSVKLDLSERAQDIQKAKELALEAPDVDMEKVEKFRKLIDEGKYKVDAKSVADRMVNDSLMALGRTDTE